MLLRWDFKCPYRASMGHRLNFFIHIGVRIVYADTYLRSGHSVWAVLPFPGSSTSGRQSGDHTAP